MLLMHVCKCGFNDDDDDDEAIASCAISRPLVELTE
jgi:hypothetical protein